MSESDNDFVSRLKGKTIYEIYDIMVECNISIEETNA